MVILGLGFLLGLGGVGLTFSLLGLVFQLKYRRISRWPVVEGVVVSADLKESNRVDSPGGTPQPVVLYHFKAGGRAHNSTRIRAGAGRYSQQAARAILERFPPGAQVSVHYNLENPQDCVLETPRTGGLGFFAMGVVLMAVGIGVGASLLGWRIP